MDESSRNTNDLVDAIYEAAVASSAWPVVLQTIADRVGARGAALITRAGDGMSTLMSPGIARIFEDYVREGWTEQSAHAADLLAEMHPGFRTEADYHTPEEIAMMPVHAEFFAPRGYASGAGTVFQGAHDDLIQVTFEGFGSHAAAAAAVPVLDALRPHLGRAVSLAAQARRATEDGMVQALGTIGVGAAVVDREGRLRSANDIFLTRLQDDTRQRAGRLVFRDPFLHAALETVLASGRGSRPVRSIALRARRGRAAVAVHLLPLPARARDLFESDGQLLLMAEALNASLPNADLLRLLFDLTPAEARLARKIAEGTSLVGAARDLKVSDATARSQIRAVFAKTGVARQTELVRLLAGLGAPDGS